VGDINVVTDKDEQKALRAAKKFRRDFERTETEFVQLH
jgi:hypothetical protein